MLDELKEIILENNSEVSRRLEHLELEFFSLTQLLMRKGIISKEEYIEWLSEQALAGLMKMVNEELEDYDD